MGTYLITAFYFECECEYLIVVADTLGEAETIGIAFFKKNDLDVECLNLTQKGIVRHIG